MTYPNRGGYQPTGDGPKSPPPGGNFGTTSVQVAVNAATHGSAPPQSGSIAGGILAEAANIVGGARNATHGDKERSFQVIADLWNAYLNGRKVGGPLTPFDVAQFMVLLKVGRSISGTPIRDHFVDAAGYSGIAGELVEGKSNV